MAEPRELGGRDPSGAIGRNLEPFLLFELLRAPSYGYDLIRRLADRGFRRATAEPAVVYRVLRSLEDSGFIRSIWSTQESGPARRYYELTEAGRAFLEGRIGQLQRYLDRVERLLHEYEAIAGADGHSTVSPESGVPSPEAEAVGSTRDAGRSKRAGMD